MRRKPTKRSRASQPVSTPSPVPAPAQATSSPSGDLGPDQLCALAVADLAGRLHIAPESIAVRTLESVDWLDASLGCPEPDTMYGQVITPGYRIILAAGDRTYAYHASLRGVKLCER